MNRILMAVALGGVVATGVLASLVAFPIEPTKLTPAYESRAASFFSAVDDGEWRRACGVISPWLWLLQGVDPGACPEALEAKFSAGGKPIGIEYRVLGSVAAGTNRAVVIASMRPEGSRGAWNTWTVWMVLNRDNFQSSALASSWYERPVEEQGPLRWRIASVG